MSSNKDSSNKFVMTNSDENLTLNANLNSKRHDIHGRTDLDETSPSEINTIMDSNMKSPEATKIIQKDYLGVDLILEKPSSLKSNETQKQLDTKYKISTACILIIAIWLEFGCGWIWMVQASTKRQTIIYYDDITTAAFRSLNEIWLYVYLVTGPLGIYIIDKNFRLGIFLACFFQGIGSILL